MSDYALLLVVEDLARTVEQLRITVLEMEQRTLAAEKAVRGYSMKDICEMTQLSAQSVAQAVEQGQFPGLKIGAKFVFPPEQVEEWNRTAGVYAQATNQPRQFVHSLSPLKSTG